MKYLSLAAAVLVIAPGGACTKHTTTVETGSGTVTTSGDAKTTTIQGKDATAVVGANAVDPAKLGVPIYPGAVQQEGSIAVAGKEGGGAMVSFKTADAFDKVYDFYKSKLPADAQSMKSESGNESVAQFHVGTSAEGTAVMISAKQGETDIIITRATKPSL